MHKWGGEYLTKYSAEHVAYDYLFLHLYREEIDERFRNREYWSRWQSEFLPDAEDSAAIVRQSFCRMGRGQRIDPHLLEAVSGQSKLSASAPIEQMADSGMTIDMLWHSADEGDWLHALERYGQFLKPGDVELVRELEPLSLKWIQSLDPKGWYDFLHDKYFRWKYTAANRLATTRQHLRRYLDEGTLGELFQIKEHLLAFPKNDIKQGLSIATSIHGLGTAGASGLLALMYPESFGTVDQFVVKALRGVSDFADHATLKKMKPEALSTDDGVALINIMREKASANNIEFGTTAWTPKRIDEILWTYGRD